MKRLLDHPGMALAQLMGGDVFSKALLVAANILLIRAMPASEFAIFTTMFALVQFSYQAVCGIIERLYIAEHQSFRGAETRTLTTLLFGASVLVLAYFATRGEWLAAALSIAASYAFGFFQLTRIRLQKDERYTSYVVMDVARNVLTLGLLFILIVGVKPQAHQAFLAILVFAVGAICAYAIGRGSAPPVNETNTTSAIRILFARKALIAYAIVGAIFPYVPIVLADQLRSEQVVASYGVAQRYQAIVSMLVVATNVYMLPRISNIGDAKDAIREAVKLFKSTLILTPIVGLYVAIVWFAMPFLNGPFYDDARPFFLLLAGCGVFSLLATAMVNLLLREERYLFMLGSIVAGLTVNIALGIAALDRFGPLSFALGALAGYAITNVCFLLGGAWILRRAHSSDHV